MAIKYVIEQDTKNDGLWTSDPHEADDMREVRQTIVAGWFGEARRAVAPDGKILFGVDAKGKPIRIKSLPTYQEHGSTLPPYMRHDGEDPAEGDLPRWSGRGAVPKIGASVNVAINGLGEGKVLAYFTEHGFLGLLVKFKKPPAWYVKQHGKDKAGHVFGAELQEV